MKMDLAKAVEILEFYQKWRKGKEENRMVYLDPLTLSSAIDLVIEHCKVKEEKFTQEMFRDFIRTNHLTKTWDAWIKQYKK